MRRAVLMLVAAGLLAAAPAADARELHGVPLPSGTRALDRGDQESGLNFRKTVDFYRRYLKRAGLPHDEVRPYRHRGVVVARFVARASAPWAAIHVFWTRGRTRIYVVPAPPPTPARPTS